MSITLSQPSRDDLVLPNPSLQDEYQLNSGTSRKGTRTGRVFVYAAKIRTRLELDIIVPRRVDELIVPTIPNGYILPPTQDELVLWFSELSTQPVTMLDWLARTWIGYVTNIPIELTSSKNSIQLHITFTGSQTYE